MFTAQHRFTKAVAVLAAAAGLTLTAAPAAFAAQETRCSNGDKLCNTTYGDGTRVASVLARRTITMGETGFFEVFGPNNFKVTGPTNKELRTSLGIERNFPNGSLICLRFFKYLSPGNFTQVGGNACTSVPIGR